MNIGILKKRFFCILCFVFVSIGTYAVITTQNSNSVKVNALPITNKIIVIDAGHGKPDEGAVGFNGTTEEAITLSIALKLQKYIEQSGAKVILTRSDENGIYSLDSKSIRNKKVSDIKNRVDIGNNSDADIFISIHLNKFPSEIYKGWQTFYQKSNENSKNLAKYIQDDLSKNIEFKNNRIPMPISDIYIMEHVKIPTVIIECGFLSNPQEAEMLKGEDYQNKLSWGIFVAIQDYFQNKSKQDTTVQIY